MEVKISLCQKIAKWQPEADCLQDMNSKKNIYSNVLCPQIKAFSFNFFLGYYIFCQEEETKGRE